MQRLHVGRYAQLFCTQAGLVDSPYALCYHPNRHESFGTRAEQIR
jgi:hypothetical protein